MTSVEIPTAVDGRVVARAQYAGLFDPMTRLPGWVLLLDRTRVALSRAVRRGPLVAVIVMDDVRRSSPAGPDFATFVRRLPCAVRPDDTVARIGTRTFVVVLNDIDDAATVQRIAQRLVHGAGISCRLGIGIGHPPDEAEALLDRALREAASLGGDGP